MIWAMKSTTFCQPNMSKNVKSGIVVLKIRLNNILSLRKSREFCEKTFSFSKLLNVARQVTSIPTESGTETRKKVDETTTDEPNSKEQIVVAKQKKSKRRSTHPKLKARSPPKSKPTKKKSSKEHSDTLLIQLLVGKFYADVLGESHQNVKPTKKGAVIKALRKTRASDLLVQLIQSLTTTNFSANLHNILGANTPSMFWSPSVCLVERP